ncbi:unnamed protein product (mitochondrion) [Plasmodiophora brassicae]|uniref:Uncharacterized protein n=1 Tax=Plasmodiophora brassicae TaxID=37360 RepID=A0A3P3XZ49_PLABS|nr:unnamed protein product [Plasmodiophora brassicae]
MSLDRPSCGQPMRRPGLGSEDSRGRVTLTRDRIEFIEKPMEVTVKVLVCRMHIRTEFGNVRLPETLRYTSRASIIGQCIFRNKAIDASYMQKAEDVRVGMAGPNPDQVMGRGLYEAMDVICQTASQIHINPAMRSLQRLTMTFIPFRTWLSKLVVVLATIAVYVTAFIR